MHFVKSVRIRSYSGPYFPTFGLNTERYLVYLRIQSKCTKLRTRITPITETFHAIRCTGTVEQLTGTFRFARINSSGGNPT